KDKIKNSLVSGGYFKICFKRTCYFLLPCSSETVSLWRPFFLRLANTLRPLAVDMRSLKPCTLLRRRLCGWYVRFFPGILFCFSFNKFVPIPSRAPSLLFVKGLQK